jgi:hypothetical protein
MAAVITELRDAEACELFVMIPRSVGAFLTSPALHDENPEVRTEDDRSITWHWPCDTGDAA